MVETEISRCRAALRRAGVSEFVVGHLRTDTTLARGHLLLQQEMKAQVAIEQLEQAVQQARGVVAGPMGLVNLDDLSGRGVLQALMELQGLRIGIEFVTGSKSDLIGGNGGRH